MLVIVHSFNHEGRQDISIPIGDTAEIKDIYEQGDHAVSVEDGFLKLTFEESFDAVAVIFG